MRNPIALAIIFTLLMSTSVAFSPVRPIVGVPTRSATTVPLYAGMGEKLPLPPNEFSRTIQPDRVIKTKKDFSMQIEAKPEECDALAARFELPQITRLEASLCLRQERIGAAKSGGIEVEGIVKANVIRRCVRTNAEFSVDVEMPLYSIVRPTLPLSMILEAQNMENNNEFTKGKSKKSKSQSYRRQQEVIDDMELMQVQRLLQQDISADEDVLIEDESIYSLEGKLDVGELVAQLFWLGLDPYPKKPGTDPIFVSISG